MASSGKAYNFICEPSTDQLCPICVEPLMQPYLTECGHYLCYTCRGRLLAGGKDECPECREPNGAKDARLNKHLQRQVNNLKVRCQHHEVGCQWVGELMYLKEHLGSQCDFIFLTCPLGCGERVHRSEIEEHKSYCSKRRLKFSLLPMEFTITDFLKMKESDSEWVSPPFYTHPHGYKLCLVVYPNGMNYGKGSHVSVFVGLLKGKDDQQLAWPLEVDVSVELLNWREDKRHHERTLTMNSEYYRVTKNGIKMSHAGGIHFIHHSLLSHDCFTDTEYLKKGALRLRVVTATIHTTSPVALTPSSSQSVFEFKLTEFSKRKQSNNTFYSPPFYTHQGGYKMCFRVHANGDSSVKHSHVSVIVTMMPGDNDDQLQWPFTGDIIIELVNCREDKGHFSKTLSINAMNDLKRVTEGTVRNSFGLLKFISHSSLAYDPTSNTEYLQHDSLHLRVKQLAVYSTPRLLKTPLWQDPAHNSSQSVYEFTLNLTEFTKRRQFNSIFFSPPLYTSELGYKLCLSVHANSSSSDTHISVFVQLMAGDNDDQLQWPFVGDIDIMLLNWREDNEHYTKTLSITATHGFVRVLKERFGKSRGYPRFISHSSLPFSSSTNTEYLQEDCLRFRVKVHRHSVV